MKKTTGAQTASAAPQEKSQTSLLSEEVGGRGARPKYAGRHDVPANSRLHRNS